MIKYTVCVSEPRELLSLDEFWIEDRNRCLHKLHLFHPHVSDPHLTPKPSEKKQKVSQRFAQHPMPRSGSCYSALCFSRGALPQYSEQLNPYLRHWGLSEGWIFALFDRIRWERERLSLGKGMVIGTIK